MGQVPSIRPDPSQEGQEVDLEPIRNLYDVATNVLKLGRRWLLTEPAKDIDPLLSAQGSPLFHTFMEVFQKELFGRSQASFFPESLKPFISANRPLSDALDFMTQVSGEIFQAVYPGVVDRVGQVAQAVERLANARTILGEVLDDLESQESPTIRPSWNREAKQLRYGETLCREYGRVAPEQFEILDAFELREWPPTVQTPWRDEKKLRDTINHLNAKLLTDSPIRFEVRNMRPSWFRFRPRSGSV
jgi:hypothetical protein